MASQGLKSNGKQESGELIIFPLTAETPGGFFPSYNLSMLWLLNVLTASPKLFLLKTQYTYQMPWGLTSPLLELSNNSQSEKGIRVSLDKASPWVELWLAGRTCHWEPKVIWLLVTPSGHLACQHVMRVTSGTTQISCPLLKKWEVGHWLQALWSWHQWVGKTMKWDDSSVCLSANGVKTSTFL